MSTAYWSLFLGVLLILMVLMSTLLERLPLSNAMIYLALGFALGPGGMGVIAPDPIQHAGLLELITEIALLISLFAAGLKLGVPPLDIRWVLPLRLAFPTMVITIALIAFVGMWGLGLSLGAAVLLGGILAPTDPVLAAGIQPDSWTRPGPVSFGLAGESALNDGAAYPFVLLGLGLMGLYDLGIDNAHWWKVDLLWAPFAGLFIGALLGSLLGKLIVYLRTRHHAAVGLDEFLALGLIAISYGIAQICLASGFLAVFAAGVALHRVREGSPTKAIPAPAVNSSAHLAEDAATHPRHASTVLVLGVKGFNEQMEKLAELTVVLVIGAMLPYAMDRASLHLLWFVPLLFLVLRPFAVWLGLAGTTLHFDQYAMLGWFGIRGIGSVFYLMFALKHGVEGEVAETLISLTLITVAISIVVHGVSVLSLTEWYARRKRLRV